MTASRKLRLFINVAWLCVVVSLLVHDCANNVDHHTTALMIALISCGWVIGRIVSEGLTALHEIITASK